MLPPAAESAQTRPAGRPASAAAVRVQATRGGRCPQARVHSLRLAQLLLPAPRPAPRPPRGSLPRTHPSLLPGQVPLHDALVPGAAAAGGPMGAGELA